MFANQIYNLLDSEDIKWLHVFFSNMIDAQVCIKNVILIFFYMSNGLVWK